MMASVLAFFCYIACFTNKYVCTWKKFPDISHVMGRPPLNQLYSIMLTLYSYTKLAETRVHYDKLVPFAPPFATAILVLSSIVSFVMGPCIGYFDCYFNMQMHVLSAGYFTLGELIYVFTIVIVVSSNRDRFGSDANYYIDNCILALVLMAVVGVLMQYSNNTLGFAMSQFGEWIAFYSDFFIRYNLASIMKYKSVMVPSKTL